MPGAPAIHILFFYTLSGTACGYAAYRGGAPERWVAGLLLAGIVATSAVAIGLGGSHAGHFVALEFSLLIVDSVMLAALMAMAAMPDRFWSLWMTALHGFGVVGHVAKAMAPEIMPNVYQAAHLFAAYPVTILLILPTRRHVRQLREAGYDRYWSIFWHPLMPRWRPTGPTG